MGVHNEALATGHVITHGERRFTFKLIDQGERARYAREFYHDARRLIEVQQQGETTDIQAETQRRVEEFVERGDAPEEVRKAQQQGVAALASLGERHDAELEELRDDYIAGKFDLLSKRGRKSVMEPQG